MSIWLSATAASQNRVPALPRCRCFRIILGYRSFDEDKRIFHQVRSKGFILELAPLVGANDRVNDMIGQIFSDILMPGSKFSVTNYSSPRVAEKLQAWALPRYKASGVFQTSPSTASTSSATGPGPPLRATARFSSANFRVLMSVGDQRGLRAFRPTIFSRCATALSLRSSRSTSRSGNSSPTDLIRLFDEILAPSTGAGDEVPGYNRFDPINEQCVRRDLVTHVEKDRLILHAQSLRPTGATVEGVPEMKDFVPERFDIRTMAVRNFPDRWAPWDTQKVIGDIFNPKLNLPCPVLQTVCGIIPGQESSEAKAGYKFARTSSLAEGKGVKLVPKLRTEASEWEFVQDRVKQGEKLVSCYYAVSILSPKGRGEPCERTLKALYKASGWDLIDETHIQLPAFMSHFPLMLADGLDSDYKRMKRLRTMRSANVAAIAPIQGEYVGGNIPHLLFIGRRGQPQFWSPFQNSAGNHNVAIAGQVGLGQVGSPAGSHRQLRRRRRQDDRHRRWAQLRAHGQGARRHLHRVQALLGHLDQPVPDDRR